MKGVLHTIEVVIAVGMLAVAMATIFRPLQPADNSAMLAQSGYAALKYLDDSGQLRQAAATRDVEAIRLKLQPLLPNFEIEICDTSCKGASIEGAIAVNYFISGYHSFAPLRLRLYVW